MGLLDFFRCNQPNASDIEKQLRQETEEKVVREFSKLISFSSYLVERDPAAFNRFYKYMVESFNYQYAINTIYHDEYHTKLPTVLPDFLEWIELKFHTELSGKITEHTYEVHPDDEKYYSSDFITRSCTGENKPLFNIGEIPIIVSPWNVGRITANLISINESNTLDGNHSNIENTLIKPLDVCICERGNHSQFSAITQHQGTSSYKKVLDISEVYKYVKFDGLNFKPLVDETELDEWDINFFPQSMLSGKFPEEEVGNEAASQYISIARQLGTLFELSRFKISN